MQGPCTPPRWRGSWEVPELMVAPAPGQLRPSKAHKGRRSKSQPAGGASIHKNVAYVRSAAPRNPNPRRTGGYIGNKIAIVKARFFTESRGSTSRSTRTSLSAKQNHADLSRVLVLSMRFPL